MSRVRIPSLAPFFLPSNMKRVERRWRGFLVAMVAVSLPTALRAANVQPADLVVRGANVITVDKNQPLAQAFPIADGNFVAVGNDESVRPFIGANTRALDLAGKSVVPGFF